MDKQQLRDHHRNRLEERREAVRKHSEFLVGLDERVSLLEEDPVYEEVVGRLLEVETEVARFRASTATFWQRLRFLVRGIDAR